MPLKAHPIGTVSTISISVIYVSLIRVVGSGFHTGSTRHIVYFWPIMPSPGGMKIDRGNRSTRRKHAPAQLCPPQIPLDQTRARTRAAAVGSQRLTARAMARPVIYVNKRECVAVSWGLMAGIKMKGLETERSHQSSAEWWSYNSTLSYLFMASCLMN
jgi:hypothetical protein